MNLPKTSLISVLAVTALLASAQAQTNWLKLPIKSPQARNQPAFVYMHSQQKSFLFGGESKPNSPAILGDTWSFDGSTWTQLAPVNQPKPRSGMGTAYDPVRDRMVIFSGWNGGSYLRETWEWDGSNWAQMTPTNHPPQRDWSAMAFDFRTLKTIMFSGHDWTRAAYNDTWAWDGTNWTQLSPKTSPSARIGASMVFDPALGGLIMIGGTKVTDMWMWTGQDWLQIVPKTLPTPRHYASLSYDPLRQRVVLYGGVSAGTFLNDLWEWDGTDWQQRTLPTPLPASAWHAVTYQDNIKHLVSFGGATIAGRGASLADTYAYGPTHAASSKTIGTGCLGGSGVAPALDCGDLAWLGQTYQLSLTRVPAGSACTFALGFSETVTSSGLPLPFDLSGLGMTGCSLQIDPAATQGSTASASGDAQFKLTIPNNPVLLGASVFSQSFVLDPSANALGLTVSGGCGHVLGGL